VRLRDHKLKQPGKGFVSSPLGDDSDPHGPQLRIKLPSIHSLLYELDAVAGTFLLGCRESGENHPVVRVCERAHDRLLTRRTVPKQQSHCLSSNERLGIVKVVQRGETGGKRRKASEQRQKLTLHGGRSIRNSLGYRGADIVAQRRTDETLAWLLEFVVTEAHWPRRPKLRPSTPEMLAALSMIAVTWRDDPDAAIAVRLAEQSKDGEVRAKIAYRSVSAPKPALKNE